MPPDDAAPGEDPLRVLIDFLWAFAELLADTKMYPYQAEFGKRFIESVVTNDGEELTALFSRQSGKTETVANVVAALVVMLPILARTEQYEELLGKFARGVWVGTFAPVSEQAETLFERISDRLTSEHAVSILSDPEIDEVVIAKGSVIRLKRSRSLVRVQTAHPKAKIESKTYHIIVMDEAQTADERVWQKSISPMGSATNATKVMTGTCDIVLGVFYKTIKFNKRSETERGGVRNHFEFDYRYCSKYNENYNIYVKKQLARLGPDSDEFRLAYRLEWILERGMFTTTTRMDTLGDPKMDLVRAWPEPCLVGIDPARKIDSTVVTVVWVDWDRPNENGLCHHRILNWLDMPGEKWEEQYFRIVEFLSRYNVQAVAVDEGGMGDLVVDRLRNILPPDIEVRGMASSPQAQSDRWKHFSQLMDGSHPSYGHLLGYPASAAARRTKIWKRWYQQMTELEKKYSGPHMLAEAPNENGAHDDFCDSAALACYLSKDFSMPEVEVTSSLLRR